MKPYLFVLNLAIWSLPACGQVLSVSSITTAPGKKDTVTISLASPQGTAPLAIQFEVEVPAALAGASTPQTGEAATKAGKTAACSGRWVKAPRTYGFVCIIAGGNQVMGDGPVVTIPVEVPAGTKGSFNVNVKRAHAVSSAMKKVPIKDAQGTISLPK